MIDIIKETECVYKDTVQNVSFSTRVIKNGRTYNCLQKQSPQIGFLKEENHIYMLFKRRHILYIHISLL